MPLVLAPVGGPSLVDQRGDFRRAFCAEIAQSGGQDCDRYLRSLPAAASADSGSPVETAVPRAKPVLALFLPGIFAECIADRVKPFEDAMPVVRQRLGVETEFLSLPGRMGGEYNAAIIAARVLRAGQQGYDVILIGYSKGGLDGLIALGEHPNIRPFVRAMLTVTTPVYGTPLADELGGIYRHTIGGIPLTSCPDTDGEDLRTLSEAWMKAWWQKAELPATIPIYAIAGAPRPERVSAVLRGGYDHLFRELGANDSQVPLMNAFAPGAHVLAVIDADHWGAVMPAHKMTTSLARDLFVDDFPRGEMVTAALAVILHDLHL